MKLETDVPPGKNGNAKDVLNWIKKAENASCFIGNKRPIWNPDRKRWEPGGSMSLADLDW